MRKFKLIKEYPGSPKLNTIIIHKDNGWIDPYPSVEHDQMILIDWVIKYPQYWEEIIEKDYEILSLKYNDYIYAFIKNNKYFKTKDCSGGYVCLKDILTEDIKYRASIRSVRRISDGEIFTIGDRVCFCSNRFTLVGFRTSDTNAGHKLIVDVKSLENNLSYSYELQSIKHIKQPLFTTEDDVDIFEGATFYHVDLNWYIGSGRTTTHPFQKLKGYKEFSTKEKAQEYIDLNKPKYSLNDILSVAKDYYVMPQSFIDKLKQLNK